MPTKKAGVTIAEVLIGAVLGGLLLTVLYMAFVPATGQAEKTRASLHLQQDAAQAVRLLQRDLMETSVGSVKAYPDLGLSLESPRSMDKNLVVFGEFGAVRWQKYVYYWARGNQMFRAEGPLTDAGTPYDADRRIPVPSGLSPDQAPSPKVLARTVKSFTAEVQNELVNVTLMLEETSSKTGKVTQMQIPLVVHPENL